MGVFQVGIYSNRRLLGEGNDNVMVWLRRAAAWSIAVAVVVAASAYDSSRSGIGSSGSGISSSG